MDSVKWPAVTNEDDGKNKNVDGNGVYQIRHTHPSSGNALIYVVINDKSAEGERENEQ